MKEVWKIFSEWKWPGKYFQNGTGQENIFRMEQVWKSTTCQTLFCI
jgi:hypothetical protein